MTEWETVAFFAGAAVGVLAAYAVGRVSDEDAHATAMRDEFRRGVHCGHTEALAAAETALNAPSEGKPGRSIVGRAIVRKLRALAEGTGE